MKRGGKSIKIVSLSVLALNLIEVHVRRDIHVNKRDKVQIDSRFVWGKKSRLRENTSVWHQASLKKPGRCLFRIHVNEKLLKKRASFHNPSNDQCYYRVRLNTRRSFLFHCRGFWIITVCGNNRSVMWEPFITIFYPFLSIQ
jgi:hypothetical protein